HAIDSFILLAGTKTATGATSPLATQPVVHDKVGRAEALVAAGRAYLFETARLVTASPEGGPPLLSTPRLAAAQAAQNARAAVDLVYEAGGGTSIYEKSSLEALLSRHQHSDPPFHHVAKRVWRCRQSASEPKV